MQSATLEILRAGVAEYMGTTTMPLGNAAAYDKSIQAGVDYCWRYAAWVFSIKRDKALTAVVVSGVTKYYMPTDFDILGWRDLGVEEYSTQDADTFYRQTGRTVDGVWLEWDDARQQFQVMGGTADMRVAYQIKPPQVSTGTVSFPSLDPLFLSGALHQKQKDMPNSSNVTQPWDILHEKLDQLSGMAYMNTPHHRPRNRYEQYNTYTGDTR